MSHPSLKLLNDNEKRIVNDLFRVYKLIYLCKFCGRLYGSDYPCDNKICPVCEGTLHKRNYKKYGKDKQH